MSSACSISSEEIQGEILEDGIQWNELLNVARNTRPGKRAEWAGGWVGVGDVYLERRVQFSDCLIAVASVRLPSPESLGGARGMLSAAECMEIEMASARFLRRNKLAPCQQVYAYNVETNNDVGAPYAIMECGGGKDLAMFGKKEQDRKFRKQMAGIQAKLAACACLTIGSPTWNKQSDGFFIGPELRTGQGPWERSDDYFAAIMDYGLRACAAGGLEDLCSSPSFSLPVLFKELMSHYAPTRSTKDGRFCLMDRNFGARNLLVDDDFNIVGMVRWDGIMAAPIEQAAQFPRDVGLSRPLPAPLATEKAAIEIRTLEYQLLLESAEPFAKKLSQEMKPKGASIMQGLVQYQDHNLKANNDWMDVYNWLLQEHIKSKED